jgi:PAS domain-containing protein
MAAAPKEPFEAGRLLDMLEPLVTAETLPALLECAVHVVGSLEGAEAVAAFVTEGTGVVAEAWRNADEPRQAQLRPHFLGLATQSVQAGVVLTVPFPAHVASGLEPRLWLLQARGRTLGALCCASPSHGGRPRASDGVMVQLSRVLAHRVAALQESAAARATRAQYERWFRQLDNHIRVLDRERQKFAAMVNQSDTFVFVADATRAIRWANRSMGARFATPDAASWIGKRCRDLCAHFEGGTCEAGARPCPVQRAMEQNHVAHEEFRQPTGDGDRNLYATALPIKGPEGRPHEVIVLLQDLSGLETVRRSEAHYRVLFEERHKAEKALADSETRLRTVVASSPIVLFATDAHGIFTVSEGRGLESLGLTPGEVVGCSAFEMYRDTPEIVNHFKRALKGEELTAQIETGTLSLETHYVPQRNAQGAVIGVIGVATVTRDMRSAGLPSGSRTTAIRGRRLSDAA